MPVRSKTALLTKDLYLWSCGVFCRSTRASESANFVETWTQMAVMQAESIRSDIHSLSFRLSVRFWRVISIFRFIYNPKIFKLVPVAASFKGCARLRCFPLSGRHRKVFGSFRRHGLTSDEASALPGERGLVWLAPTVAEWGRPNVFPWWSGTRANRGFRMADVFSGSVESILAAVDRQIGATVTYMLQQSVAWFRFRVIIADLLIIHQGCTPLAPRCCSIKLEQNRPPTGSPDRNPFFKRVLLLHVA